MRSEEYNEVDVVDDVVVIDGVEEDK